MMTERSFHHEMPWPGTTIDSTLNIVRICYAIRLLRQPIITNWAQCYHGYNNILRKSDVSVGQSCTFFLAGSEGQC